MILFFKVGDNGVNIGTDNDLMVLIKWARVVLAATHICLLYLDCNQSNLWAVKTKLKSSSVDRNNIYGFTKFEFHQKSFTISPFEAKHAMGLINKLTPFVEHFLKFLLLMDI